MKKILILFLWGLTFLIQDYGYCVDINESEKYGQVKDFSLPPWKMYPELEYRGIGWKMGYGEYYLLRWNSIYESFNVNERQSYNAVNPEPESWKGFYNSTEKLYIKLKKD